MCQAPCQIVVDGAGRETPGPVPGRNTGPIHTSVGSKTQYVLHGNDRERRHRIYRGADQSPVNSVWAGPEISLSIVAFVVAEGLPPAAGGVGIVGAGVDDR